MAFQTCRMDRSRFSGPSIQRYMPKGWHFVHSQATSDVAIIGSSNMTKPVVDTVIECNIHTSASQVIAEFHEVFQNYWDGAHAASNQLRRGELFSGKTLEHSKANQDWKALCELLSSDAEPRCKDTTGGCNHPSCVTLSRELERHEKRRDEIVACFKKVRKWSPRKRRLPLANTWDCVHSPHHSDGKLRLLVFKHMSTLLQSHS